MPDPHGPIRVTLRCARCGRETLTHRCAFCLSTDLEHADDLLLVHHTPDVNRLLARLREAAPEIVILRDTHPEMSWADLGDGQDFVKFVREQMAKWLPALAEPRSRKRTRRRAKAAKSP